jgi:hypothetical protein
MEALSAKKVFVLGAGFSAPAGFPLVSALREGLITYIDQSDFADWTPHTQTGDHGHPAGQFHAGLLGFENLEFEELLPALDRHLAGSPGQEPARVTRRMLIQGVGRWLWDIDKRTSSELPQAYSSFAGWVRGAGNAIVSFNWDLVLERTLEGAGIPWGYSINNGPTPVLKPHGSINWSRHREACLDGDPGAGWMLIAENSQYCFDGASPFTGPFFDAPGRSYLNDDLRLLIPPGAGEASTSSALLIWREVEQAISERDAIVFIGYSLPNYDGFARDLLQRCAKGKTIQAVTPSEAHCEEYRALFGGNVAVCQQKFEDCPYAQPPK